MALPLIQRFLEGFTKFMGLAAGAPPRRLTRLEDYEMVPTYYETLLEYYANTGLYDQIVTSLLESGHSPDALRGLRNPAFRIVEFYADHVWPGPIDTALPLEGASSALEAAIEQVWTWSNWQLQKELAVRWLAIYGDLFIKVVQPPGVSRVQFQLIDPRTVTDMKHDDRDYLTMIRLDTNFNRDIDQASGLQMPWIRTEIWDKDAGKVSVWEHQGHFFQVSLLGEPVSVTAMQELGVDFIPFVHIKFKNIGEERGASAYSLARDKIDEVNRTATRLHQILFRHNRPMMAVTSSGTDAANRPIPAPTFGTRGTDARGRTPLGDDDMMSLPGGSDVKYLVPPIDYANHLATLNADIAEIERDYPELLYYRLTEMGDTSGRSIRFFLGPAIKRVIEVRTALEFGLVRADQMAITVGQHLRLEGFSGLGDYLSGALDHSFTTRDVIPNDELFTAEAAQALGQAATYWLAVGVKPEAILTRLGFDPKADLAPPQAPPAQPGTTQNAAHPGDGNPPGGGTGGGLDGGGEPKLTLAEARQLLTGGK